MDDSHIVELYWTRSEDAIVQTEKKYGKYCFRIAHNILANREDAEESVNDTYLKTWNSLPPQRPTALAAFLGRLTRNLAISRWRARTAAKRGRGETALALEELDECITASQTAESDFLYRETVRAVRQFLDSLPEIQRDVFLRRYFFLESIASIASAFGFTQSKVKSMLFHTRQKLRAQLQKEDLI